MFYKQGALKIFEKNNKKTSVSESLNNLQTCVLIESYNFLKNEIRHRCFLVNFAKILRITFYRNLRWLQNCIWNYFTAGNLTSYCYSKMKFTTIPGNPPPPPPGKSPGKSPLVSLNSPCWISPRGIFLVPLTSNDQNTSNDLMVL